MNEILKKIDASIEYMIKSTGDKDCDNNNRQIVNGLKLAKLTVLADQAKRKCKNCIELGKCEIYDNFNIDYCSDFEEDIRKQK